MRQPRGQLASGGLGHVPGGRVETDVRVLPREQLLQVPAQRFLLLQVHDSSRPWLVPRTPLEFPCRNLGARLATPAALTPILSSCAEDGARQGAGHGDDGGGGWTARA